MTLGETTESKGSGEAQRARQRSGVAGSWHALPVLLLSDPGAFPFPTLTARAQMRKSLGSLPIQTKIEATQHFSIFERKVPRDNYTLEKEG